MQVLSDEGHQVAAGEIGSIAIKLPMPPGTLPTLWRNDDRFVDSYLSSFEGYYATGDAGYIDEDGYIFVMSRTDDIINVAGHRLSTGGMEEVLAGHPDVAECAVIGVNDALKGQVPLGFVVLKSGTARAGTDILAEIVQRVRSEIGPVAAFKQAIIVGRLPKTRSGKILRATMQKIVQNEEFPMPATIDDPVILDEIDEAVSNRAETVLANEKGGHAPLYFLFDPQPGLYGNSDKSATCSASCFGWPPAFSIAAFKSCCLHRPSMRDVWPEYWQYSNGCVPGFW